MKLCSLMLAALLGFIQAQDVNNGDTRPLQVRFEGPKTRTTYVGGELAFSCVFNRGLLYVIKNIVETVRQSVDGTEVVLAKAAMLDKGEPGYYSADVTQLQEEHIRLDFNITNVRDIDEGRIICRVQSSASNPKEESGEDYVDIVVQRPLEGLHLKFGTFDPISKDLIDPVEIDSGVYTVECIAEGSNPAPTVKLYLHNTEITDVVSDTNKMEGELLKYKTRITGSVSLSLKNSKQKLECRAIPQFGEELHVRFPVKIKIYDPVIFCNNSEAYNGQKGPILTCTVDYEGLDIEKFQYEFGGQTYSENGEQNADFVEVSREQLSDTKARVHLKLDRAQGIHFKTEFNFLVVHEDGHVTRKSVLLQEIPGPGDMSSIVSGSVATILMSYFALWLSL